MLKKYLFVFVALVGALSAVHARAAETVQMVSQSDREVLDDGEVGTAQYVAGGVVGTVLGLGVGEAIQGRYYKTGWIVTAGELTSLAAVVAGATSLTCSETYSGTGYSSFHCSVSPMTTIGAIGFIGFRIFELIDVWAGPPTQNARYRRVHERSQEQRLSLLIAPTGAQSAVGGLQFRF